MLQCYDFDDDNDPDEYQCCGTCHGGNFYEDDVRLTFMLTYGSMAELCCGKIRKLVADGRLNKKHLEKAH